MSRKTLRRSVRWKYTLLLVGTMVSLILLLWLSNRYLLRPYYQKQKLLQLGEARSLALEYIQTEGDSQTEPELALRQLCEAQGINAIIIEDQEAFAVCVFSTTDSGGAAAFRLLESRTQDYRMTGGGQVLESGEDYVICRIRDIVTGTEQIDCMGSYSGDTEFVYLLTTPVTGIEESVDLSNRFLLLLGLITSLLGAGVMYFMSRKLTEPIISLSETLSDTVSELQEANKKLEADIREKEAVDRQRRELLANISHELKTPIALVEGYAEGLRDGISEDAQMREQYCEVIMDEAGRMNRLVRELLNLNELESGLSEPSADEFDLCELLRSMAGRQELALRDKNARLELELPESLPVVTDEFLLEQVVQNYLSNAVHYVEEGGRVSLNAVAEEGRVTLRVFNSGSHIPSESLPQVWDKFYKVDKARTRAYGGSGIGLSIVRAALDRLGGSYRAENVPEGVVFSAEFPQGSPAEMPAAVK